MSYIELMLSVNLEQHVNVKNFIKLEKSHTETYHLLKEDYIGEGLSCTVVFNWFKTLNSEGK